MSCPCAASPECGSAVLLPASGGTARRRACFTRQDGIRPAVAGCAVPPYFWNFIVKRRTGRSTHIGNTLQKGIQARFHQSGTMHRLPLHNAYSPLRAQLSGVMSTPSLQPMRCQ